MLHFQESKSVGVTSVLITLTRALGSYHSTQNNYSYKSEIKSKTIGLYQITGVTVLY